MKQKQCSSFNNLCEWPLLSGTIADHLITFLLSGAHHRSRVQKVPLKDLFHIVRAGLNLNRNYKATITKTKYKIGMSVLTSLSWKCQGVVYNPNPASTLNNPIPTQPNLTLLCFSTQLPLRSSHSHVCHHHYHHGKEQYINMTPLFNCYLFS